MNSGFHDPAGEQYGLPTYPWRSAPAHLRTERQLAQDNRRPGDEAQAQVMRNTRRGLVRACLYDEATSVPKRECTEAQLESLRIARWVRSADACERRGVDAADVRELIEATRIELAARRQAGRDAKERDRGRSR
ncbi:hypothetical protein ACFXG4_37720 [Nocardia sp. NPDC059246]|uniref:hypothetical protein n=1 Tax=unclassified Nocardia TaxID=2637762 RepID=UPI0036BA8B07